MATKVVATMKERTKLMQGTDEHLANVLRSYSARGHLVTHPTDIRPTRIGNGMSRIEVTVMEPVTAPPVRALVARWVRGHRALLAWSIGGASFVAFVLWLVVYTIAWFAQGAAAVIAKAGAGGVGVIALVALVVWLLGRAGGSGHGGHSGEGFHWSKCK
jgi:hypothetical protein